MARGRFISNSISGSKKFARLTAHDHRLMYMMLVPHADAEGRHDADPQILAGQVYTRLDFTPAQIEAGLRDMHDVGLIRLYAVGDEQYLEIVGFHEHNKVRRKDDGSPDREAPSAIPAPPPTTANTTPEALPTDSGVTPEEDQSNSALRVKGKGLSVKGEGEGSSLSFRDDAPDPAPVEAAPRRPGKIEPPPEDEPALTLADLIVVWNEERGQLRAVRDTDVALADANLVRLAERFVRRHRKRDRDFVLDLFRRGISAVRIDPHWLGSRAEKPTRTGPPYGIDSYLRHVETKADAAADLAATPPLSGAPPGPTRPFAVDDLLQHNVTGQVGMIDELLPGNKARMNTGDTWNLAEVYRCNN